MTAALHVVVELPEGSRNNPTDYGYIPDTLAIDGDPLDALVCVSEATFPGCVIPAKAVALLRMRDEKGSDKQPEGKHVKVEGWRDRGHALALIARSRTVARGQGD